MTRRTVGVVIALSLILGSSATNRPTPLPRAGSVVPFSDPTAPAFARRSPEPLNKARILKAYEMLPMYFEANQGQADGQVKFLVRGTGYALFLTPSEAVLVLRRPMATARTLPPDSPSSFSRSEPETGDPTVLRMKLVGANPSAEVSGVEEMPGKVSYFVGNDPRAWRTRIPIFARVKYRDVYPGVDLVFYGRNGEVEYDFVVAAGADPTRIRLALHGADKLEIDARGDLVLHTAAGKVSLRRPLVYQDTNGTKQTLSGRYVRKGERQVAFHVAAYDRSRPLVIDPVLSYSTYLGGSTTDYARGIALDPSGNAYVIGSTYSPDFPVANPLTRAIGGIIDAFVTKLDSSGSALVYSTYLGGNDYEDGFGIAVDAAGSAYVTGRTLSADFPLMNPLQPACGAGVMYCGNAFVTKIAPSGSALVYSTFLGGSSPDEGNGIAVDATGAAYVVGWTASDDFPTMNPLQPALRGIWDAFVAKVNPAGSALVYSTYLGGSDADRGLAIAVDPAGSAYVTGWTSSPDFPTVNPLQPAPSPRANAFVAKLDPAGSRLVYSTYLGGDGGEVGLGIAVDAAGYAYVTGWTGSADFPTKNALQPTIGGGTNCLGIAPFCPDAFVAKLDPSGSAFVYSTYLGGSDDDRGMSIAVDGTGQAYVTGLANSADFPTRNPIFSMKRRSCFPYFCPDGFAAKVNPDGSALAYSTYLGGANGFGIAVDSTVNAYIAGDANSGDLVPWNPLQPVNQGYRDAFAMKIRQAAGPDLALSVNQMAFRRGELLTLRAMVAPGPQPVTADVYLAVRIPDGTLLFVQADGSFTADVQPFERSWPVSPLSEGAPHQVFAYTFAGAEPPGSYTWLGAFTEPGTFEIIGDIARAPFTFVPSGE